MAGEEKDTFTETGLINVKAFTTWGDITMSLQIHKCWQSVLYSSNLWKRSNGISRAKWSKYSYDEIIILGHGQEIKEHVTLTKDFDYMIESEEWINEGYEIVPSQ